MTSRCRLFRSFVLFLAVAVVAVACGGDDDEGATGPAGATTPDCLSGAVVDDRPDDDDDRPDIGTAVPGEDAPATTAPGGTVAPDETTTTEPEAAPETTEAPEAPTTTAPTTTAPTTEPPETTPPGDDAEGALPVLARQPTASPLAAPVAQAAPSQDVPDPRIATAGSEGGDITIAVDQEPASLVPGTRPGNGPWARWLIGATHYRGAVTVEPDGTLVRNPDLVDAITMVSEDPLVVEYVIGEEADWSDGTPVTGEDLAFTWEAQRDPGAANAPVTSRGYASIAEIEAADAGKTVTVTFEQPYADWPSLFAHVYPRHVFDEIGDGEGVRAFREGVTADDLPDLPLVSSGPYQLAQYETGDNLILQRNPDFAGRPGGPDRILGLFLPDAEDYPTALADGDIDLAVVPGSPDLVAELLAADGLTTEVEYGQRREHLQLNVANPVFRVPEIRQAVALGLDRQALADAATDGIDDGGAVLDSHVTGPDETTADPSGRYGDEDRETARQLLADLGCGDGDITLDLAWHGPDPRRATVGELVADQLGEIGIDVELQPEDDGEFLATGDFDLALHAGDGDDPLGALTPTYATGGARNVTGYTNADVDDLLLRAETELDESARVDLLDEVDRLLWQDLPAIPLHQRPQVITWRTDAVAGPATNAYAGPLWNVAGWTVR